MSVKILHIRTKLLLAILFSLSFSAKATDCSLIAKFSFAAGEFYARGIPQNSFVTSTFAGFMSAHRELLDDPRAVIALTEGLNTIYEVTSRMGSALNIGETLKSPQPPSEALKKTITNIAQLQLGLCMGKDDRAKLTKS